MSHVIYVHWPQRIRCSGGRTVIAFSPPPGSEHGRRNQSIPELRRADEERPAPQPGASLHRLAGPSAASVAAGPVFLRRGE